MKPLRKGARALDIDGVPFAWLAGKTHVEIRNRNTNRAYHVPSHRLEVEIEGYECCGMGLAVQPGAIEHFIRTSREEHGLL